MMLAPKIPLWLDCDTGHDDAFAILLAANHEQAELLGVSTVHGNASLEHTTSNSYAILHAMGRTDVPVVRGEARPLQREACFAPQFHGESGLDGVSLLPSPEALQLEYLGHGVEHIRNAIMMQEPNTASIVATGPLTNIAKLFLQFPEVVSHIRSLSVMGGAIGNDFTDAPMHRKDGPGNWTPYAEFNIFCDPEAAHTIFSNKEIAKKTTLIPLDLTHLCRGTSSVQEYLFGPSKQSTFRRMMRQILTFFTDSYQVQSGIHDGPPLHDPLAVYAVLCPERFDDRGGERWTIETSLNDENPGQTSLSALTLEGVRIPRGLDLRSFWEAVDHAMAQAERKSGLI